MWRRIFIPLVGLGEELGSLTYGFACALSFSANVETLFVRENPADKVPYMGPAPSGVEGIRNEYVRYFDDLGRKHEKLSRRRFGRLCKKFNMPRNDAAHELVNPHSIKSRASFEARVGNPLREIPQFAMSCDVTVFPFHRTEQISVFPNLLEQTLIHSGRPMVLVPQDVYQPKPRKVVVAWDGTSEAARAAREALPLLDKATEVLVVTSTDGLEGPSFHRLLVDYLVAHGVPAVARSLSKDNRHTGSAILNFAAEESADLLVMGAYSHSRALELLIGGVTIEALQHAEVPILMMH